jgi:hypothetical protein
MGKRSVISLLGMSFEEALKGMLNTPPPPSMKKANAAGKTTERKLHERGEK